MRTHVVVASVAVAVVACIWLATRKGEPPATVPRPGVAGARPEGRPRDQLSAQAPADTDSSPIKFHDRLRAERHRFPAESASRLASRAGRSGADEQSDATEADADDDFESVKQTALTDSDAEERASALMLLSTYDDALALPVLTRALSDSDAQVRLAALDGLESLRDDPPFETIASVVNDPDPEVRTEALKELMNIDEDRAQPFVQAALSDPNEDVRDWAEIYADVPADEADAADAGADATQP